MQIITILTIYTIIIYIIAFAANKNTQKVSDYIIGGRNINGFVTALSTGASDMSSWLLMALPGSVLIKGINIIWLPIFLTTGAFLNWTFIAKRLRIFSEETNNALTIPEFLANRFGDYKKNIRILSGVFIIIFFCFYAVSGFVSAAKLVEITFGINYKNALLLSAIFIVFYTAIGGFLAISWVDVFQGILIFFSLLVLPIFIYFKLFNFKFLLNKIIITKPYYFDFFQETTFIKLISFFAWGLAYCGQPHIIGRFMAIKSPKEINLAKNLCTIWMFFAMIFSCCIGVLGALNYLNKGIEDPERVFLLLSKEYFNQWINGIMICAVISSIISTVSCLILIAANALVEDIAFSTKSFSRSSIMLHRISVLFISIIAVWIASNPNITIMQSVAFPWCGLGASFGPVIILSLYWKRINYYGAIAGILTGSVFVLLWEIADKIGLEFPNKINSFPGFALVPGFIISTSSIILVSLFSKPPHKNVLEKFEIVLKKIKNL